MKKRIAFAIFNDEHGVVDEYVIFFLKSLRTVSDEINIICNGKLTETGQSKLSKYGSVVHRKNKKFDVDIWKEALQSYGWDNLISYDSLILCDFTCFGPFISFTSIFEEMDDRNIDFWGLTPNFLFDSDYKDYHRYEFSKKNIQSYFMVINNRLLASKEFRKYWTEFPAMETFEQTSSYHETVFTEKFSDLGFSWDTYVKCDELKLNTTNPALYMPHEMIANYRCPIIKKECFFGEYVNLLTYTTGQNTAEALDYIENNLDYDTGMIYDNILRTLPQADVKNFLQQNYILPTQALLNKTKPENERIALVMHIYYPDLIDHCLFYARSMPSYCDLIITVPNEEVKKNVIAKFSDFQCNTLDVRIVENRGRDVSAKLVGCADIIDKYDYICFVHGKKTPHIKPRSIGESFFKRCFDNLLYNDIFVQNVLQTFRNNSKLGMLCPPPPNHGIYFFVTGAEWGYNYSQTAEFLKKMNVTIPISEDKEPIAPMGSMFWARSSALKKLFEYNWTYDDFPTEPLKEDGSLLHVIERAYPFFVQEAGYIPAWVLADSYASTELTNLNYMLREINVVLNQTHNTRTFLDTTSNLQMQTQYDILYGFTNQNKKSFLYRLLNKALRIIESKAQT